MTTPRNPRPNPYVGPRAFEPDERLYGRDTETRKLANLLGAERVVLLHSPSGAGKTSLIQAALIPKMRKRKFHIRPVARLNYEAAQHPSDGYNRYLVSALSALESAWPDDEQLPDEALARLTLPAYLARRPRTDGLSFELLIFDQFEEVLTLDPTDQAAKHAFFAQLGEALEDRTRWALFSIREDFLGALAPYVIPIPNRLSTTFRLDLLGEDAARQALQRPVRAVGAEFDDEAAQRLVDDLRLVQVQRPDGELETQLGPHVEPVQLQVVGYRLWESLAPDDRTIDVADVAALGDVGRALAGYYAERVAAVASTTGANEREIREWFDHQLITEQGIRGQVLQGHERSEGLENRAIGELVDTYLVRAEQRRGVTWYELAHDRLIEPIRENNAAWEANLSTLQRQAALWKRKGRPDELLLRDQALVQAKSWAATHPNALTHNEVEFLNKCQAASAAAERERRNNRIIRGLAIVVTIIMVVAIYSFIQARFQATEASNAKAAAEAEGNRAKQAEATAEMGRREAETAKATAEDRRLEAQVWKLIIGARLESDPDLKLLLAVQAARIFQTGRVKIEEPETNIGETLRKALQNFYVNRRLVGHTAVVNSAAFSPDGRFVVTASDDHTARVWNAITGEQLQILTHLDNVNTAAFSYNGQLIVTVSDDHTARVWDMRTGKPPVIFSGVNTAAFSPTDNRIVTANLDRTTSVWDASTGAKIIPFHESTATVNSAVFSDDGTLVLTTILFGRARLWKASTGDELGVTGSKKTEDSFHVVSAALNPGHKWIVTAYQDYTVHLWNTTSWSIDGPGFFEELTPPDFHATKSLKSVEFSRDGQFIVIASDDRTAQVGNVITYAVTDLRGHIGAVNSAAFSPDSQWVVTASEDDTARVWKASTGKEVAVLGGHTGAVTGAIFSQAGTEILTFSTDKTARVWEVRTEQTTVDQSGTISQMITLACTRVTRELTDKEQQKYLIENATCPTPTPAFTPGSESPTAPGMPASIPSP